MATAATPSLTEDGSPRLTMCVTLYGVVVDEGEDDVPLKVPLADVPFIVRVNLPSILSPCALPFQSIVVPPECLVVT